MFLISPSTYQIKTLKKKGRGVFAAQDIEAGTVIGLIGGIVHFAVQDIHRFFFSADSLSESARSRVSSGLGSNVST